VPTGGNGIPPGWAGLSPDGQWVVIFLTPEHYSYTVNLTTQTLSTSGTMFWDACYSDHGDVLTTTTGTTYAVTANCRYGRGYYRVALTNNATGQGANQLTLPGNVHLLPIEASNTAGNGHFACAARGRYQDWCYGAIEDPGDLLGNPGTWYHYKQELVLMHMLPPYEVRRLAHHRARPWRSNGYGRTARVATNWDGTSLMFLSPMSAPDDGTSYGYADIWRYDVPKRWRGMLMLE
jgi:hypothetical protein